MPTVRFAATLLCSLALTLARPSSAFAGYTFTKVTDAATPSGPAFGWPAINNAGQVSMYSGVGGDRVLRGTAGGPVETIARVGADGFSGTLGTFTSINDAGVVAFDAFRAGAGLGIYTRSSPTAAPTFIRGSTGGEFSINNAGVVAFADSTGVFAGNGGPRVTVLDGAAVQNFRLDAYPHINSEGVVVFGAMINNQAGLFLGDTSGVGSVRPLLLNGGPVGGADQLSLNDFRQVAFHGYRSAGGEGIYIVDDDEDGLVETVADTAGAFTSLSNPSINNREQVVFRGAPKTGAFAGIFTGPDPVADKVIAYGDPLFGGTVNFLDLYADSINDAGQIAFVYGVTSGTTQRFGIAVASVPDPGGAALLPLAAVALLRRRTQ